MQISNANVYQKLSQYADPAAGQASVSASARPVIIEGQVLDNKDTKKRSAHPLENDTDKSKFTLQEKNQPVNQAVLMESVTPAAQNQIADYLAINRTTGSQSGSQYSFSDNSPTFPYSNRRSYNGLSGSPLIVQSYLNNSPSAVLQQPYSPGGVDYYV